MSPCTVGEHRMRTGLGHCSLRRVLSVSLLVCCWDVGSVLAQGEPSAQGEPFAIPVPRASEIPPPPPYILPQPAAPMAAVPVASVSPAPAPAADVVVPPPPVSGGHAVMTNANTPRTGTSTRRANMDPSTL